MLLGHGDRAALDCDGDLITYSELDVWTDQVAAALQDGGVGGGQRFVLWAPNSVWYVLAVLGGMKAGAVPVLVPSSWSPDAVEAVAHRTGAMGVLATPECPVTSDVGPRLRTFDLAAGDDLGAGSLPLGEDSASDDIAYVTCVPDGADGFRAVAYAHRVVIGAGDPIRYGLLQLAPDDVCLVPGELSGDFALDFSVYLPLSAGAQTVLQRGCGPADPKSVLAAVERNSATILVGTPDLYRDLAALGADGRCDLGPVRLAVSVGDVSRNLVDELRRRLGLEVVTAAGDPETHVFAATPEGQAAPGVLGLPLVGRDVEILTKNGAPAAVGQIGRLCLRSDDPGLAAGYDGMHASWRSRHQGGFYCTDRFAYRDEAGCLHQTSPSL